ncbi:uncharacterized protein LOC132194489 [Neocloeon triangulifer]|uniref:uncharacterized protein LOC132194489 n=1 Tax=Neocloeon triangulifer TaxID=2078957 RepID=UPI00286F2A57|nr:uncharacterized protein LOC132194489 [Neocloeon triangulifer]
MDMICLPGTYQSNYYSDKDERIIWGSIKSNPKANYRSGRDSFSDLPLKIPFCTSSPKIPIYRSSLTDDLDSLSNNSLGSSDRSSFASSSRRSLSDRTASLIDFFVRRKKSRSESLQSGKRAQKMLKYFDGIDTSKNLFGTNTFLPSQWMTTQQ